MPRFEKAAAKVKQIIFAWAGGGGYLSWGNTRWIYQEGKVSVTEIGSQNGMPIPGTFKNWYIRIRSNTIDGDTVFTFRKNGVSQPITITVGALAVGLFSDLAHSFEINAGDLISVQIVTAGTTGTIYYTGSCVEFDPK